MSDALSRARVVADAVLYEGYLLYPYRASSAKNVTRWQFGVLGPPGAAEAGVGEPAEMSIQTLLSRGYDRVQLRVRLRFLQLQRRQLYDGQGSPVDAVEVAGRTELSWDEAVEHELPVPFSGDELAAGTTREIHLGGGEHTEQLDGGAGRLTRERWPLHAEIRARALPLGDYSRLEITVRNTAPVVALSKEAATRLSLLGAHLIVESEGAGFVSVVDPPADAAELASQCRQDRCWPFLAGVPGDDHLLLGSPIILYDHPEVAPESAGALFDATEIDEILTLRVMTMTDEEKAEARATDPHARAIIDRCDAMSPEDLQQLHGVFRDPHGAGGEAGPPDGSTEQTPWWDPEADSAVRPEQDSVLVGDVEVRKGTLVRVRPSRRADAQDIFFADQVARVTAVLNDVDGGTHVALVLVDDPAADLHDWYGRYFYFAPDEIEPLTAAETAAITTDPTTREESRP